MSEMSTGQTSSFGISEVRYPGSKGRSNVRRLNGQRDERPAIPDLPAPPVLVSTE
ncbi:MAG TPA: hypothetical protein VL380_00195 [Nitrosospira sp.]|nr:hypothetical protein [Nitrosospira sp.]